MTSLFNQYVGDDWRNIPVTIQQLHDAPPAGSHWLGWSQVRRGKTLAAKVLGRLLRLPPTAKRVPVTLHITHAGVANGEQWLRNFGGHLMRTEMTMEKGGLVDSFGFASVGMHVEKHRRGLVMSCNGAKLFGISLPKCLWPRIEAYEHAYGERCYFSVKVNLPVFGLLVHYHGWFLVPELGRV